MVELRKRPPPKEPAGPPPKRGGKGGSTSTVKKIAERAKAAVGLESAPETTTEDATVSGSSTVEETKPDTGTEPEKGVLGTTTGVLPETVGEGTSSAPAPNDAAVTETSAASAAKSSGNMSQGSTVDLSSGAFAAQGVVLNDSAETTLKDLVEKSGAGVVVFTYPKASTPGCTTQACLFRDNYAPISGAGFAVYGLSTDSPKSNTTFVTKQNLQYPLLCDPNAILTTALGMKKPGPGKSTTRGVVIIDKQGVVKLWKQAGPKDTLEAVLEYIKTSGVSDTGGSTAVAAPVPDDPVATQEAAKLKDPYHTEPAPTAVDVAPR